MKCHAGLYVSFGIFVAIAGLISICQADCFNADFVAYSTVASRVIESPASSVTGYWSPLYSWLMVPLLLLGSDDVIAGRIVLLISGLLYIGAVDRLATRCFPSQFLINRLLTRGLLTCATVQAIWFSTYLLNPDLLACAIVFWYFVAILDERTARDPRRSFVAGMVLGMAYLAKAYMLPFCVAQLLMSTATNWLFKLKLGETLQPTLGVKSLVSLLLGLGIMAGPWIAVLTQKYERLTFTTAGRANHANVGPESFGKDPLWHPPLTPGYIMEPVLAKDWSPFASGENFRHQVRVILHNTMNCIGLIPGWLMLSGLALLLWFARGQAVAHPGGHVVWWGAVTAAVYCSGYLMVNLETRYIVPVVAPLLCLCAAGIVRETVGTSISPVNCERATASCWLWFCDVRNTAQSEKRLSIAAVLVVLVFAAVDIYGIVRVAIFHPQSSSLTQFRAIASQLEAAGIEDQLSASNRWHDGLSIAYARGMISNYLGMPQAADPLLLNEELVSNGGRVFFRWTSIDDASKAVATSFTEGQSWNRRLIVVDKSLGTQAVEVYVR